MSGATVADGRSSCCCCCGDDDDAGNKFPVAGSRNTSLALSDSLSCTVCCRCFWSSSSVMVALAIRLNFLCRYLRSVDGALPLLAVAAATVVVAGVGRPEILLLLLLVVAGDVFRVVASLSARSLPVGPPTPLRRPVSAEVSLVCTPSPPLDCCLNLLSFRWLGISIAAFPPATPPPPGSSFTLASAFFSVCLISGFIFRPLDFPFPEPFFRAMI